MMKRLPKVFRNFYFLSLAFFFAWMLLLDSNNLVARYQLGSKLNALEDEKEYYEEKIREVKPAKFFVAADGPRAGKAGEQEKCEAVRNYVIKNIDWACEVKTLFRQENLYLN